MFRKTIAAAIAVATISGSALFASTAASQAGYDYKDYVHGPKCYYTTKTIVEYVGMRADGRLIRTSRVVKVQVCN